MTPNRPLIRILRVSFEVKNAGFLRALLGFKYTARVVVDIEGRKSGVSEQHRWGRAMKTAPEVVSYLKHVSRTSGVAVRFKDLTQGRDFTEGGSIHA